MSDTSRIRALLIDDDQESLRLLKATLDVEEFGGYEVEWVPCASFEEAGVRLASERFDLVASDVYRDREGVEKNLESGDNAVNDLVVWIRGHGFCPVLVFSSGVLPDLPARSAFVRRADKSEQAALVAALRELLETGIPAIASRLHRDLYDSSGSYLWAFLESEWERLRETLPLDAVERLVRRRAGLVLARLDSPGPAAVETSTVEGGEYYVYPSLSKGTLRLGEVLREKGGAYHVVLTPHCDLVVQEGAQVPRAESVLLVGTTLATTVLAGKEKPKSSDDLASKIGNPSNVGKPRGRYWFLPGFLDIPDLYCDFMCLSSNPYTQVLQDWEQVATLDSPFAEALQVAFASFYGRVGTPDLLTERFRHLLGSLPASAASKVKEDR